MTAYAKLLRGPSASLRRRSAYLHVLSRASLRVASHTALLATLSVTRGRG